MIITETRLHSTDDQLVLYNYIETPLVFGLYPMACLLSHDEKFIEWKEGYSGHVTKHMSREYITDHFFPLPTDLISEIVQDYSLIEIWSGNF